MRITARTLINRDLEEVWHASQDPERHEQWDLRFSSIRHLPQDNESGPQRFIYQKRLGFFGITIEGWGESVGGKDRRSSSLRFGSSDCRSLIKEGVGSWVYEITPAGTCFSTTYDYTVRYGSIGMLLDKLFLRPLMTWGTQWSFDRLRLWLERDQDPALSLRLWLTKSTARVLLGLVWIYEGIIPKLLFVSPEELQLVADSHLFLFSPSITLALLGLMEVLLGLWLVSGYKERISTVAALVGLFFLPIIVIFTAPEALIDPFGGISKNLGLIGCAVVSHVLSDDTPSGYALDN